MGEVRTPDSIDWLEHTLQEDRYLVNALLEQRHEDLVLRLGGRLACQPGRAVRVVEFAEDDAASSELLASEEQGSVPVPDAIGPIDRDATAGKEERQSSKESKELKEEGQSSQKAKRITRSMSNISSLTSWGTKNDKKFTSSECWDLAFVLDTTSGIVVLLNVIVMAAQVQYRSYDLACLIDFGIGPKPSVERWPHAAEVFEVLEWMFGLTFIIELLVRVLCCVRPIADLPWNILDAVTIAAWFIDRLNAISIGFNPTLLRMVRWFRMIRLMRAVRMLQHFDPLFLIIKSIQSSMSVLAWTVALLVVIMMVVAMFICFLLEPYIKETAGTADSHIGVTVFEAWGSFTRAYVSMFEITFANWGPKCWVLVNHVDEAWGAFFILWRCCFGYAVIQVITSVFIQNTFKTASRDEDVMIKERARHNEDFLRHLDKLFSRLDRSGDGKISRDEFEHALSQPVVMHWFEALEIDVSDIPRVFQLLDDGQGEVGREEFITGIKRLKGGAQNIDVFSLQLDVRRLRQAVGRIRDGIPKATRGPAEAQRCRLPQRNPRLPDGEEVRGPAEAQRCRLPDREEFRGPAEAQRCRLPQGEEFCL